MGDNGGNGQPQPEKAVAATAAEPISRVERLQKHLKAIEAARQCGYEADPCPECGSFTLVRNGTCLRCDTCGGTTGCS